jgi:formate dehydrogenase maturation protein FdhE
VGQPWVQELEGGNGAIKAEICSECQGYAKMLYQAQDMAVEPIADDLASLGLDTRAIRTELGKQVRHRTSRYPNNRLS